MTEINLYRNMLAYADSEECPIDKREEVKAAATDMINRHYKDWADTLPDPFAYKVVKKERVCYDENGRLLFLIPNPRG